MRCAAPERCTGAPHRGDDGGAPDRRAEDPHTPAAFDGGDDSICSTSFASLPAAGIAKPVISLYYNGYYNGPGASRTRDLLLRRPFYRVFALYIIK